MNAARYRAVRSDAFHCSIPAAARGNFARERLPELTSRAARRLRNLVAHVRHVADEERIRAGTLSYGRLDYARADVHLQLTSRHEFHRLRSCEKEPWTVQWIERYLKPGDVLYDVGANVGAYSLLAAVSRPGVRVVSFEPGPANIAALSANAELNGVSDRVTVVPIALGDRARTASLARDSAVAGASPRFDGAADAEAAFTVLVDRLEDVIRRFDLPAADHLKLDVDGTELEILAGAEHILASDGLRSVMIELERDREREVVDLLLAHGFQLLEVASGQGRAPKSPAYGLFTRS